MARWLLLFAGALVALLAIERVADRDARMERAARDEQALGGILAGIPASYKQSLARIDLGLEGARARAAAYDGEWLMHERVALRYLERARLTGSFDDYAASRAALDRAFAVARPGTGPHATRAALEFTMHRLAAAERQLDLIDGYAVPPYGSERAEHQAMRGDIAFYRGDYAGALAAYDAADATEGGASDFRRGVYHMRTGRFDLAEEYYDRAERGARSPPPQFRAFMELQRGILDLERGRWDPALAHFTKADAIYPGYWLIEEHIAEVQTLKGDLDRAEVRYRDIVRRTAHPEFMDALPGIETRRGNRGMEMAWRGRAAAAWRKRLRQFPEAAYGHALDHCVQKGDWACALDLARRNHAARPYGEARIMLARALLHNGRGQEARRNIEAVLASPWRTAALHSAAAEIFASTGSAEEAERQRRLAFAIDPHALDGGGYRIIRSGD
jgi:tetratricopeptide (TPR) repeat protein